MTQSREPPPQASAATCTLARSGLRRGEDLWKLIAGMTSVLYETRLRMPSAYSSGLCLLDLLPDPASSTRDSAVRCRNKMRRTSLMVCGLADTSVQRTTSSESTSSRWALVYSTIPSSPFSTGPSPFTAMIECVATPDATENGREGADEACPRRHVMDGGRYNPHGRKRQRFLIAEHQVVNAVDDIERGSDKACRPVANATPGK